MPLYEYYCEDCKGVFEMLRPVREAQRSQPCPECNEEASRYPSREFSAFIMREGAPRRLPDRGTYWHLEKVVSRPVSGSVSPNEHPDINVRPPPAPLSVEEIEQFEDATEEAVARKQEDVETLGIPVERPAQRADPIEFVRRLQVRGTDREERVKRRAIGRFRKDGGKQAPD